MKILIIGYSNLFKNRILPLLDKLDFIESVCIGKYKDQEWDNSLKSITKPIKLFNDYETAISNSRADLAYISTTNNSHFIFAKAALNAGMHTIIDKPATIHLHETEDLVRIASAKQLLLSESTVYLYHPQLNLIKDVFNKEKSSINLLTATFSFPLADKNNFRYKTELGGGAFLDTSPYAVSIGRYFFNTLPDEVNYVVNEYNDNGLEISYSLLLKYPQGKAMIGHFGFNSEYVNRLSVLGENVNVDVDRIFTIPETLQNSLKVRANNNSYEIISPCGNTFEIFLKMIAKSINEKSFEKYYNDMHMDVSARQLIKISNKHKILL